MFLDRLEEVSQIGMGAEEINDERLVNRSLTLKVKTGKENSNRNKMHILKTYPVNRIVSLSLCRLLEETTSCSH